MSYALGTAATISADGSITFHAAANPSAITLRMGQILISEQTECIFMFICDTRTTTTTPIPQIIGLCPVGATRFTTLAPVAGFKKLNIGDPVTAYNSTAVLAESAISQLSFQIRGGVLRYFQDARDFSAAVPLSTVGIPLSGTYELYLQHSISNGTDEAAIQTPKLIRHLPSAFYSAADQVTDFGSTQSAIKVHVTEISSIVGAGSYAEATI